MKFTLLVASVFSMFGTQVFSFSPSECSSLLKFGIYDEHHIISDKIVFDEASSIFCSDKAADVGFTFPVEGVPVQGSASSKESLCSESSSSHYEEYHFNNIRRSINGGIIKAFDSCLSARSPGVAYYVRTRANPENFAIRFEFEPFANINEDTVSVLVEGASCSSAAINGKLNDSVSMSFELGQSAVEFLCIRNASQAVQVTAHAERTNVTTTSIELPEFQPQPEPPSSYTFYSPLVDDAALDMCAAWASSCAQNGIEGKTAADLWCHNIHLGNATSVGVIHDAPPTKIITSKQLCNVGTCDRVSTITCAAN